MKPEYQEYLSALIQLSGDYYRSTVDDRRAMHAKSVSEIQADPLDLPVDNARELMAMEVVGIATSLLGGSANVASLLDKLRNLDPLVNPALRKWIVSPDGKLISSHNYIQFIDYIRIFILVNWA